MIPGLTLARALKERYPHLHITLGGPIFSVAGGQLQGKPEFFEAFCHSIVTFEGEDPLHQLLTRVKNGSSLEASPNLIYLDGETVVQNKERVGSHYTGNLKVIPHLIPKSAFSRSTLLLDEATDVT